MEMTRKLKRNLCLVLIVLSVGCGLAAYFEYQRQETQTISHTTLAYGITPQVASTFWLRDNSIYDEDQLPGDRLIINQLIDKVHTRLQVDIDLTEGARYDLELGHAMHLVGVYGEDNEELFHKTFDPYTYPMSGQTKGSFNRNHVIDLDPYKRFLLDMFETTDLYAASTLKATWTLQGRIWSDVEEMTINETFEVIFPINREVFKPEMLGFEPRTGELTKEETLPVDKSNFLLYLLAGVAGFFLILMAIIIWLVPLRKAKSEYDLLKEQIFREHGDRLAQLHEPMTNRHARLVQVNKVEDLVKISDEIRQPVFYYEIDEADQRKMEFYVFDDARVYYMIAYDKIELDIQAFIEQSS